MFDDEEMQKTGTAHHQMIRSLPLLGADLGAEVGANQAWPSKASFWGSETSKTVSDPPETSFSWLVSALRFSLFLYSVFINRTQNSD